MCAKSIAPVTQARQSAAPGAADDSFDKFTGECKAELKRMSAQLLEIQESERRRIATDLHDGLGQSLTMIKHALDESALLLERNEVKEALGSLQHLKHRVKDALDELHSIALDLRPAMLDDLGVLATLSWFFREFQTDCHDIKVEKHFQVQESNIPVPLKIVIFRIIQEATNNIVKHAHASWFRVILKKTDNTLHLSVEDNGDGFDTFVDGNVRPFGKGLGLLTMAERAEHCGGRYMLESAVGQGTRIDVTWLLDQSVDGSDCGSV